MELNDELVDKLAMLSRLQFDDEEKAAVRSDLSKMLSFVDKLNELDTEGLEPLMHISNNVNVLREDIVEQGFSREEALKNATLKNDPFFRVPKVINK